MKSDHPFFDAPKLPVVFPLKKRKPTKEKKEVSIKGLDDLTCHVALFKYHQQRIKELQVDVRAQVMEQFVQDTHQLQRKPDSFFAVEDMAKVSCELRRKGSNIPITDEMLKKLQALGLPFNKDILIEERLVIHPELDQKVLTELKEFLNNSKFKNVVYRQPQQLINTYSDETINGLAKLPVEEVRENLPEMTVQSMSRHSLCDQKLVDTNGKVPDSVSETATEHVLEKVIREKKAKRTGRKFG